MLFRKSAVARTTEVALPEISEGRYQLRLAQTADDLDAVLRLRFEVFNLELGEGLAASYLTGRDEDEFDQTCDHLMVTERTSGSVIGTYRLQTGEMAAAGQGFYSAGEFDLSHLPSQVLNDSIELGRACIAVEHRHTQVLLLLWKGIAAYLRRAGKRYLFGCCSLTSQDAREGQAVMQQLLANGQMHRTFYAPPQPGFECWSKDAAEGALPDVKIPKLFRTYLRVGAKVCGPPAIDRQFGTIDFLVLLDIAALDPFSRRMFFGK
ncbi:MAG TPA: GNAT family N-acyltransferase [Blastocatellia bacterium]|nr:GNAT family N-acyltransferase [Blastocatellia bacterium]